MHCGSAPVGSVWLPLPGPTHPFPEEAGSGTQTLGLNSEGNSEPSGGCVTCK